MERASLDNLFTIILFLPNLNMDSSLMENPTIVFVDMFMAPVKISVTGDFIPCQQSDLRVERMDEVRQAVCGQLKGLFFLSKVSGPDVLPGHYFFVFIGTFFLHVPKFLYL